MKKILTLLSLSFLGCSMLMATPLSPEEALGRLEGQGIMPLTRGTLSPKLKKTFTSLKGEADIYIFDKGNDEGFMIVSADDSAAPLLGYTDSGNYDTGEVAPGFEYWMGEYQRQIEFARVNGVKAYSPSTRISYPDWEPIAPMVKTTWYQDNPYNLLCPTMNGTRTYTGCVATAMAQVMNYHQYPAKGQGSITYQINYGSTYAPAYTTYSMDFSEVTFNWANMLDSYSSSDVVAARTTVAPLMKACGYSVQMDYGTSSSGAIGTLMPGAFVDYFNYDKGVNYAMRDLVNLTQWSAMIYDNLKNVGPLIYDGQTPVNGGHSFVCDGYQSNGYFHFNWGWGGISDGYYLLDALEPATQGIGGASGGFDYFQGIVLGIQPPKEGSTPAPESIFLMGTVQGTNSSILGFISFSVSGSSQAGLRYNGQSGMTFNVGCILEEVDNTSADPTYVVCSNNNTYQNSTPPLMPLTPEYIIDLRSIPPRFTYASLNLKDNTKYKMTLAYQKVGESDWNPVEAPVGSFNYFYITKNGSTYKIDNEPLMQFDCSELTLETTLYNGVATRIKYTLTNNNDIEFTRSATMVLVNPSNQIAYLGESQSITLQPGESISQEVVTSFVATTQAGTGNKFYLGLYDINTSTIYYKDSTLVTMEDSPGNLVYNVKGFTIPNETYEDGTYIISDPSNFTADATITVASGIFSLPVRIYVMKLISMSMGTMNFENITAFAPELPLIKAGETQTITTNINFPDAVPGEDYYLGLDINRGSKLATSALKFRVADPETGVGSIGLNGGEMIFLFERSSGLLNIAGGEDGVNNVEVYYLNGMKAPIKVTYINGNADIDLSGLGKGVVIVTAIDGAGHRKSEKIAL